MADITNYAATKNYQNTFKANSRGGFSANSNLATSQINSTAKTSNVAKISKSSKATTTRTNSGSNFAQTLQNVQSNDKARGVRNIKSQQGGTSLGSSNVLPSSNRLSNNLVQAGSKLAKQNYRDGIKSSSDTSLNSIKGRLDPSNFKKSTKNEGDGTDLALQEIAISFEQQFLGAMWNLAFRSDDREYEGGLGEELFSSELVGELVKQASGNEDARGNKIMGPVALDIYDEIKRSK